MGISANAKITPIQSLETKSSASSRSLEESKLSYSTALMTNLCKICDQKQCSCSVEQSSVKPLKQKSFTKIVPLNYINNSINKNSTTNITNYTTNSDHLNNLDDDDLVDNDDMDDYYPDNNNQIDDMYDDYINQDEEDDQEM